MPLPGGASDKAGNSYERRWTVFALIDVLSGRAESLRIEVPGDAGVGSEFRLTRDGVVEWHQVKRQRAAGPWSINALATEGVLGPWEPALDRGDRCVFVCTTGADELRELADRACDAASWAEYDELFLAAKVPRDGFDRLQRTWSVLTSPEIYEALQRVVVRSIGEAELAQWIDDRLRGLVGGATPSTAAAVLALLADHSVHNELTAADIWAYLATHGITPLNLDQDAAVVRHVIDTADDYLARLRPLYIGGHEIERPEVGTALERLDAGRGVVLAGAAGAGKSAVTTQVVTEIRRRNWPVLVVSADRLPDVSTTSQLGADLGLPESPATVLAAVAAGADALLVIDQLDAVSVTSGRHPERLGLVSALLREAGSYPQLRVLVACRQFDLDNDRALRATAHSSGAATVAVGPLNEDQVRAALSAAGLATGLPKRLLRLLSSPLHLALYVELARAGIADLASVRTLSQLYDQYWAMKRGACQRARGGTDEWLAVVDRLVTRMNDRHELSVPEPLLDDLDQQTRIMASEGVLTVGQGRIGFFHESFFDYCFARQFLATGGSLQQLLGQSEQDLFRRAQVRQILAYEREADAATYLADLAWLTTSGEVRLHIQSLVVALLDTAPNPTAEEWQLLRPIADDPSSPLHERLWHAVRANPGWFPILDADGTWQSALNCDKELAERSVWAMSTAAVEDVPRAVALLRAAPFDVWRSRRRMFLRLARIAESRELVDLLIAAIDEGDYDRVDVDLEHILRQLASAHPDWGVDVLTAFVRRAASDDATTPFHPDHWRHRSSRDLTEEIHALASAAPAEYVDGLLSLLLDAMHANIRVDWDASELDQDALWTHQFYGSQTSLSGDLYDSMGIALAALAGAEPAAAFESFERLRQPPCESAAFLLARGYIGNPAEFADEAVDWIVATPGARHLGYTDASSWVSRELVAAASAHCSSNDLERLADALLYYASPYERTARGLRARGLTELCLLNGFDEARRPERVVRRLQELRRKFERDDVAPPRGVSGGFAIPPIPEDRARRMSDKHWLRAMQRYDATRDTSFRGGQFIGDASTQAGILEKLTTEEPLRFGRLLLKLPDDTAEAYVSAILRGLAKARIDPDLLVSVCQRIGQLGDSDASRWMVRLIEENAAGPLADDLIALAATIAVSDADPVRHPAGDEWNGGSIDSAGLNSTRGAAALAIERLLVEVPTRLPLVESALRELVHDEHLGVRALAVAALTPLLPVEPDLAIELFVEAAKDVGVEFFGSDYVEHFLRHAVRFERYAAVAPHLDRAVDGDDDEAKQAAARLLVLASYYDESLDGEVDALLARQDEVTRAAAIRVFADNVTYAPRRARSIEVLSTALHEAGPSVRDEAGRVFYQLRDTPLVEYETLIRELSTSPAVADDASAALHTLEATRHPLPPSVLDLCEAWVAAHSKEIGDLRTGAAGDVMDVVRLVLRMHAQHSDSELRRRCLDLIDNLVVLRAFNIESDLDSFDR